MLYKLHVPCFYYDMDLQTYIREIGAEQFARMFNIKERTATAYMYGTRTPRGDLARKIVGSSPVTWEGIYGEPEKIRAIGRSA